MTNIVPVARLLQGSMSKTDLLLRCQYWASGMITLPKSQAAYPLRFGTSFHKTMEIHLKSKGRKKPDFNAIAAEYEVEVNRLKDYYTRGSKFIDDFINRNFPGPVTIYIEEKLAYDPFADTMRFLASKKERDYSDIQLNEFPGTGDIVVVPDDEDWFCTLDWKTGQSNYDPQEKQMLYNGQLASISLAMSRFLKRYKAMVWIIRIDDEFIEDVPGVVLKDPKDTPFMYAEDLEVHRKKLQRGISGARSFNPVMWPGAHCHELYCPAMSVCPAHAGPMALMDEMHGTLDAERKALLFERFKVVEKMVEKFGEWWKEEIRRNGPFQRENGKWAMLEQQSGRENLSKASIVRALGTEEGNAVIAQLRESGCIEEGAPFDKIVYKNDPAARK